VQAKVTEEAERYEDMVEAVKQLAKLGEMLNVEERNLLSVAYKNVVGARRASWRVLSSIEAKESESGDGSEERLAQLSQYRIKVEKELGDICQELLGLIDDHLLPKDQSDEGKVFYQKMAGDYYRYLAEVRAGEARAQAASRAQARYEEAARCAEGLPACNPIRLGLALNQSVFLMEILGQHDTACALAKRAFDGAIADLDTLSDDQDKDATLVMQLIRDNLTLGAAESTSSPPGPHDHQQHPTTTATTTTTANSSAAPAPVVTG
jgi:14-3-3 protein epsilon